MTVTPKNMKKYFEFLDDLRESGATNMFGARPYLQRRFGLLPGKAGDILSDWMGSFKDRLDAGEVKENGGLKVIETTTVDFVYSDEDDDDIYDEEDDE